MVRHGIVVVCLCVFAESLVAVKISPQKGRRRRRVAFDIPGDRLLLDAIKDEDLQEIRRLSAFVNTPLPTGDLPLYRAARTSRIPCIQALIDAGADLGIVDRTGCTAGDVALVSGRRDVSRFLRDARMRQASKRWFPKLFSFFGKCMQVTK